MKTLSQYLTSYCEDKISDLNDTITQYVADEQYEVAAILQSQINCFEEVKTVIHSYELVQTITDLSNDELKN